MDGVVKGPQDFEIGGGMKVDFHEKGPHLVDARQTRSADRSGGGSRLNAASVKLVSSPGVICSGLITWGKLSRKHKWPTGR